MRVWSLGQEDLLEAEMATYSSFLAWEIPWTGEPGWLQSMGSQRVGRDWATEYKRPHWQDVVSKSAKEEANPWGSEGLKERERFKMLGKVKEQLVNVRIWVKKTKSHNQHSDVALDDLSLEFFLEISSAICNTFCHTFFLLHFFLLFDWEPLRGFIFTSLWSLILWDHSIRKMSTPAHKFP